MQIRRVHFRRVHFRRVHFPTIPAHLLLSLRRISPKNLNRQPSIKNVTFPELIDATCLPNLTRVAALPWFPYLIAGRPVSEVVTAGYVPHSRSNRLELLHPRHRKNPETHDRLFLPIPHTRTSPCISIFFAHTFYDDNYPPRFYT
jgi:hypothetical protein